jgi:hypothetical protein
MEGGKDEQDSLLRLEEKESAFRFQLEDNDKSKNEQAPTPVEENPFAAAGRQADALQQGVMEDPFYSPEEQQSNPNINPAPTQSGAPSWSQGQVEADKRLEDIARRVRKLHTPFLPFKRVAIRCFANVVLCYLVSIAGERTSRERSSA